MSPEGDALYSKDLFLLALKGQVVVHLVEGHTLEGEFATQDLWNIFLLVDGEPMMVPRSQILYIKGASGQQIEPDTSQQAFLQAELAPEALPKADLTTASALEAAGVGGDIQTAGAGILEPDTAEMAPITVDTGKDIDITATEHAAAEPAEEEPDITYVLADTADLAAELEKLVEAAEEGDDLTVVLDEEEEDEITYVLDSEEEPQLVATLVCTTGPHAGQEFELRDEVISVGRARDNDVALSLDKEISRYHAVIRPEVDHFVIQDKTSLNGTYVNNERIDAPRVLKDGDIILVGVTDMKYQER